MLNCNRNGGHKKKSETERKAASGNTDITQSLLALLKASGTRPVTAETVAQLIADQLVRQALPENFQAIKEILNRTEGRVPQGSAAEDSEDKLTVVLRDVICSRYSLEQARADFWLPQRRSLSGGRAQSKSDRRTEPKCATGNPQTIP
jgi:hypothetical protein